MIRVRDETAGTAGGRAHHAASDRARALILDGDPVALDAMRSALQRCDVGTLAALDGTSGVTLLLEELLTLDVIVVDLHLPERDARRIAWMIRHAGGDRDLAIVVVVPEASVALRAELHALGVDAVVERRKGPEVVALAALEVIRARAVANTFPAPRQVGFAA